MERLTFDDAQILRLETEAIKGHTLKVLAVGPRPDRGPVTVEEMRATIESRLGHEPKARQRVVFPSGPGTEPFWADDPEFDLANHVVEAAVAEPVGGRGLLVEAARLFEERLDHERPLWRVDLVPMSGGGTGVVMRIHHCLADGITSQRFARALFWDDEPDPPPAEAPELEPRPEPSMLDVAGATVRKRVGEVPGAVAGVPGAVAGVVRGAAQPSKWLHGAREVAKLPATVARELLPLGGETILDRALGPRRELAVAWLSLDEMRGAAHLASDRLGGHVTLNDILLAVLAGGLRTWMEEHGGAGDAGVRVQVPVSLHGRDEHDEVGNRDSFLNVDMRLDIADPVERLRQINLETTRRKQAGDAEELYHFFHAISRFKPLYKGVTRLASGPRDFALSVSNVPGPKRPVYVVGAEAAGFLSLAEPADRHALRISAVSYAGALAVGISSDPDAVGGIEALAREIEAAGAELALALA
ncbi:MAG TPA: wax ester/triacylglycerol synthase domain-containing protein [Solirubrobacterales bacterium]